MKRRHRVGKQSYYEFGGTPILLLVLQKILTVACVLADKGKQGFHNFLEDATTWKDSQWRFTLQAIGMQDDPTQRKETWKHPYSGRQRVTWESVLFHVIGPDFKEEFRKTNKSSHLDLVEAHKAKFCNLVVLPCPAVKPKVKQ